MNTLNKLTDIDEDLNLISEAQNGDSDSFELLYFQYESFLFNLCLKFHYHQNDALDAAQEIWIHVFKRLNKFEGKSKFSTWLYKVAINHLISAKRTQKRQQLNFEAFSNRLESLPNLPLPHKNEYDVPVSLLVEEAMLSCTTAMLLCFSPKQRTVFLLGVVFELNSVEASEVLEITPENFRQQLSRTRKELYAFMHSQCGLVNPENPCRCKHKTSAFIKEKYVDPHQLVFNSEHLKKAQATSVDKLQSIKDLREETFSILYQESGVANNPDKIKLIRNIIKKENIQKIF